MSGALPLTWECLDAWSRHAGVSPTVQEADAMMALDAILLSPEARDG